MPLHPSPVPRSLAHRPWTPRERVLAALLDLRGRVPFAASLVTVGGDSTAREVPVHVHGMTAAHVKHGLEDFIPRSRDFRLVVDHPDEILDWTRVPEFRESDTAREHLLAAGYTQGVSLVLRTHGRAVGTFHFNVTHTEEFDDAELQAIDAARTALSAAVGGMLRASDVALTRRELIVLSLVATGATNPEIADRLGIARRTVATHIEHLLRKLQASNRTQAVRVGVELDLI